jgi:hypothetical protein
MTGKHIGVSQDERTFTLDFQDFELDISQIADRVSEIIFVLEKIIMADAAREEVAEERLVELLPGILARDMMYQASLSSAARNAELVHDVTTGRRSIADLGFPDLVYPILQDD